MRSLGQLLPRQGAQLGKRACLGDDECAQRLSHVDPRTKKLEFAVHAETSGLRAEAPVDRTGAPGVCAEEVSHRCRRLSHEFCAPSHDFCPLSHQFGRLCG